MVVESVVPETPEFDIGKWMDLDMMVMATGRERTAAEFRDTPSPLGIVVGKPK
jgi:hypothetical protein